jgi:CHAT domain-containing protein
MGNALGRLGQAAAAIEARASAAEIFTDLERPRFAAIAHYGAGVVHFERGEMEPAIQRYTRALELRRQAADQRGEALVLEGLAGVYKVQGETQKALDHFLAAAALFDRPQDRRYLATTLHNLATLYRRLGKPASALGRLREAEGIFAELSLDARRASSLSQIGQLELESGDSDGALATLSEALELRREIGDPRGQATVMRKIGSVYLAADDFETAAANYERALELLAEVDSPRSLALVLADLGALRARTGEYAPALDYFRRAGSLFDEIGDPIGQTRVLSGMADSQRLQGRLPEALTAVETALETSEALRIKPLSEDLRLSFFSTSTVRRLFELHIEILMALHREDGTGGYHRVALEVSERARARSLLDLLTESGAEIRDDAAPDLLARERALQKQLNASVEQLEDETVGGRSRERALAQVQDALDELDRTRAAIRGQSPRYAALTQPQTLSTAQMQQSLLDPDTLLLEYWLGTERSYLWLVSPEELISFELAPAREIEDSVRRAHDLLKLSHRREARGRTQRLLCDLSRQLLAPVAGKLGRKRLAIVAEGALQYLPFAALPDPDSTADCLESAPLVVAHEITYLPSASTLAVLREERERPSPSGLVAVLADPVFDAEDPRVVDGAPALPTGATTALSQSSDDGGPTFHRLPSTRDEAEAILELVPAARSYRALGFEASKETVLSGRLAGYRFLHFATHGMLNTEQPALSGLVLSQTDSAGRPVDGFLRAHEIYNLDLPAELVVLGACETALGAEVKGEGLIGLSRGFMYAGASRVMVSLWQVSDRTTADLMASFYRRMLEQGLPPAAALRSAQLEILERKPQPFYWAPFVVQGEWRDAAVN